MAVLRRKIGYASFLAQTDRGFWRLDLHRFCWNDPGRFCTWRIAGVERGSENKSQFFASKVGAAALAVATRLKRVGVNRYMALCSLSFLQPEAPAQILCFFYLTCFASSISPLSPLWLHVPVILSMYCLLTPADTTQVAVPAASSPPINFDQKSDIFRVPIFDRTHQICGLWP